MKERSNQTLGMVGIDENLFLNKIQKYPKACIINPERYLSNSKAFIEKEGSCTLKFLNWCGKWQDAPLVEQEMKEFGFCGLCLIIVEGEVNLKIGGTNYCGRAKGFIRAKKKKKKPAQPLNVKG